MSVQNPNEPRSAGIYLMELRRRLAQMHTRRPKLEIAVSPTIEGGWRVTFAARRSHDRKPS